MLKGTIVSFLFLFVLTANAQKKIKKKLYSITTTERAEEFLKTHKNKKNKLITFNEEKHKTRLAQELLEMNQGSSKIVKGEFEHAYYKILEKNRVPHFRASIIYLDGSKLSLNEVNQIRQKIITQYTNGTPFAKLAKTYSMDQRASQGGDLGWFAQGEIESELESAIHDESKHINDIFTVDIVSKKEYYVVLKTHKQKDIVEIKVLKVIESEKR